MGNGIYVATSGAVAQTTAMDTVASNLANASTTGFKAQRVAFASVMANAQTSELTHVGVAEAKSDLAQGTVMQTGNPLDAAIDGDGFFAVDTTQGVRYTRSGEFRLDAEGRLVDADGQGVRAEGGGGISVPTDARDVAIEPDGTVLADGQEVGRLELVRLAPASIGRVGSNLYTGSPVNGDAPVNLIPGALEQANVGVVRGMVDLIRVSRTYEALHRMIETYKEIDNRTARELGGRK